MTLKLILYSLQIQKLYYFPGGAFHFSPLSRKSNVIPKVELREGKSLVINQAHFFRNVADSVKQRLFITALNRAQPSVYVTQKEN